MCLIQVSCLIDLLWDLIWTHGRPDQSSIGLLLLCSDSYLGVYGTVMCELVFFMETDLVDSVYIVTPYRPKHFRTSFVIGYTLRKHAAIYEKV